ncbi:MULTISPECIES: hypothetical protein [unclassified Blastococcus]
MTRRTRTHPFAALLLGATLPLAACGGVADEEESANPMEEFGTEVDGGNAGPDESVTEDITLADVQLPYPDDGVYSAGEDAPLTFTVTNTSADPVTLEQITGEDFAEARISGEEGNATLEVPGNDNLYVGAPDAPSVMLVELEQDLRSSQSIPVTFSFGDGEEVTIEAVVAASSDDVPESDEDPTGES